MRQFSQILIDRMIWHFREDHGVELTEEEADNCLASFAELYLCEAGKTTNHGREAAPPASAGERTAPDPP